MLFSLMLNRSARRDTTAAASTSVGGARTATAELRRPAGMAAEREAQIARLKANDPELKQVYWFEAGVGNEEVGRLAEGLDGNTVLQMVDLYGWRVPH